MINEFKILVFFWNEKNIILLLKIIIIASLLRLFNQLAKICAIKDISRRHHSYKVFICVNQLIKNFYKTIFIKLIIIVIFSHLIAISILMS